MAAEIPSSNMHGDARSFAMLLHPFANEGKWMSGDTCLTPTTIDAALIERSRGDDLVLRFIFPGLPV